MKLPRKRTTTTTRKRSSTTTKKPVVPKSETTKNKMATVRLGYLPKEYYFVVNGTKYPGSSIVEFEADKKFSMIIASDDPEYNSIIEKVSIGEENQIQFTIRYYKELQECKAKNLPFEEYPEGLRELIIKNIKTSNRFTFKDCSKSLQDYVLTH